MPALSCREVPGKCGRYHAPCLRLHTTPERSRARVRAQVDKDAHGRRHDVHKSGLLVLCFVSHVKSGCSDRAANCIHMHEPTAVGQQPRRFVTADPPPLWGHLVPHRCEAPVGPWHQHHHRHLAQHSFPNSPCHKHLETRPHASTGNSRRTSGLSIRTRTPQEISPSARTQCVQTKCGLLIRGHVGGKHTEAADASCAMHVASLGCACR